MPAPRPSRLAATAVATLALVALAGCGDDGDTAERDGDDGGAPAAAAEAAPTVGLVTVTPEAAAATIASPPDDLVILDVRTPEEFADGHVDGAIMLDFYDPGFADALAELDPDVPYVLYCRSGNRSGQTVALMDELGFSSVEEVGGGIVAWQAAGLPVVGG